MSREKLSQGPVSMDMQARWAMEKRYPAPHCFPGTLFQRGTENMPVGGQDSDSVELPVCQGLAWEHIRSFDLQRSSYPENQG